MAGRPKKIVEETIVEETKKTSPRRKPQIEDIEEVQDKRKSRLKKDEIRKKIIAENPSITIMNNVSMGTMVYVDPVSEDEFTFTEFASIDEMDFKMLKTMVNKHPKILKNYWLIPIDVNSDEIELSDVLDLLKISYLYENEDILLDDSVDNLLKKTPMRQFERAVDDFSIAYTNTLLERAVELFKKQEITDEDRIDVLMERLGKSREATDDLISTLEENKPKRSRR